MFFDTMSLCSSRLIDPFMILTPSNNLVNLCHCHIFITLRISNTYLTLVNEQIINREIHGQSYVGKEKNPILMWIFRSSRPELFCKKGVLKSFTKFKGKHLCRSLYRIAPYYLVVFEITMPETNFLLIGAWHYHARDP